MASLMMLMQKQPPHVQQQIIEAYQVMTAQQQM
jgi:hypothetical protein